MAAVLQHRFFDDPPIRHANLLSDDKGLYGLMVDGIQKPDTDFVMVRDMPQSLVVVVREDRVIEDPPLAVPTLFHRIPKGKERWARGTESELVMGMHYAMLAQKGIKLDRSERYDAKFWRHYHALTGTWLPWVE